MTNKDSNIKSELLSLYKNGKSESEAHEEISKTHTSYKITLSVVNKWFEIFKSKASTSNDYKVTSSKKKFTDESLINLINDNPKLNMEELERLAGFPKGTILARLRRINTSEVRANYCNKSTQKFTDEYLIDLVSKNPTLSMRELSRIAGTSATTISNRIKQINRNGERVKYVNKPFKPDRVESWTANPKLADEYLINLINNNPDLNMDDELQKKDIKKFTDEFLIDLINESPDLNQEELATLTDTHMNTISRRINKISSRGENTNYVRKCYMHKFTDEFLIDLINQNPDLSMTGLAKLAGVSASTISRRIKEIINSGVKVNYINKTTQKDRIESSEKSKPKVYLTDEYLINLINENPDLNMTELAKIAGTSQPTISSRIKNINRDGERVKYVKKLPNCKFKM
ncbi:hypothetical protein CONCODRAFT_2072 [Conidiobolus coronatus NRRL 28638]|uniref:Mos1 transposase HTH domain-containing protein n=1 Tax=Conidiobolus coronatus (strain ATCC 28846 / CBS 209.66 / NRRL 28638) TaxID=796925 RepID=A0A137PIC9_CONC2|nr:hypothetical protein CONCODRAFT_2072 [Conidiobolus coronatus NRRL 28638]|eukprot:KXN74758.1 hypothetical protein CONCODRAFT_2072 [Conidiobolus coronatus NRRL 28638]